VSSHNPPGKIQGLEIQAAISSRLLKKGTLLTNGIFESFSRNAL
jgi:hypothetical protein